MLLEQEPLANADFGDDEIAVVVAAAVAAGAEEGGAPGICCTAVPGSSACRAMPWADSDGRKMASIQKEGREPETHPIVCVHASR